MPVSSPLEGGYGAFAGEEAEVLLGVRGAAARLFEGEDVGFLYGPEVGVEGVLGAPGDEVGEGCGVSLVDLGEGPEVPGPVPVGDVGGVGVAVV